MLSLSLSLSLSIYIYIYIYITPSFHSEPPNPPQKKKKTRPCLVTVLRGYCSVFVLCSLILLTRLGFENISQYPEKYVFTLSFFVFPQHNPQLQSPLCSIVPLCSTSLAEHPHRHQRGRPAQRPSSAIPHAFTLPRAVAAPRQ
jgi:hypothetical protein